MAKSVIDIEVKAEAFDRFNALFKKYNDQLSKMPGQWNKVGAAADQASDAFEDIAESLNRAASAMESFTETQSKSVKDQDKLNKHARDTEKTFGKIGNSVNNIRKNIGDTVKNLMTFGISSLAGGGLMAMGGAFSVGALAGYAGDTRRQATGMGVSGAELRAAQTSYQKFVDVDRTLGAISEAQSDLSKQYAFAGTGVDINKSPAQLIPDLLRRAGDVYAANPRMASDQLKAMGFGEFGIGVEEARRANAMKREIDLAEKRNQKTTEQLGLQDKTLEKWQTLSITIDESKNSIKSAFLDSMVPLIPMFDSLSKSFTKTAVDNVSDFFKSLKELVGGLVPVVEWFTKTKNDLYGSTKGADEAIVGGMKSANEWANKNIGKTPSEAMRKAINFFTGKGWTSEDAAAITGNLMQESSLNPSAVNPKSGMKGLAQWDTNRRRDFASWAWKPIEMASMQEQLEFINYELTQGKEKKAGAALRQAVGLEAKTKAFENKYERAGGADMSNRLGYAGAAYAAHLNSLRQNNVGLTIQNNTGGSATAVVGAAGVQVAY